MRRGGSNPITRTLEEETLWIDVVSLGRKAVAATADLSKQRAMKTSIDRIRAKIADLEARITDLRIAERELEALDTTPTPRRKLKAKAKRKPATHNTSEVRQTVGAAITEVLNRTGALPLAELAEQLRAAER